MSMHNSKSIIEWFFLNENLWLRFPSGDSKSLIVYKWKIWFFCFFFFLLLGFAFGVQQLHPALIQRPFG